MQAALNAACATFQGVAGKREKAKSEWDLVYKKVQDSLGSPVNHKLLRSVPLVQVVRCLRKVAADDGLDGDGLPCVCRFLAKSQLQQSTELILYWGLQGVQHIYQVVAGDNPLGVRHPSSLARDLHIAHVLIT